MCTVAHACTRGRCVPLECVWARVLYSFFCDNNLPQTRLCGFNHCKSPCGEHTSDEVMFTLSARSAGSCKDSLNSPVWTRSVLAWGEKKIFAQHLWGEGCGLWCWTRQQELVQGIWCIESHRCSGKLNTDSQPQRAPPGLSRTHLFFWHTVVYKGN